MLGYDFTWGTRLQRFIICERSKERSITMLTLLPAIASGDFYKYPMGTLFYFFFLV